MIEGVVYPPADVVADYRARGALGDETLGQALHRVAMEHADRPALVTPEGRYSYREFDELTDRVAVALLDLGLRPTDRALFQLGNVGELLQLLYGCFKAGIVPVCTLVAHREQEIGYLAGFTEARAHFVQADVPKFDLVAFAHDIRQHCSSLEWIVRARAGGAAAPAGVLDLERLVAGVEASTARRRLEALELSPDEVAMFHLSGGTTGIPKVIPRLGAEYIHNSLCYAARAGFGPESVAYWPLPAIHNAGMVQFSTPVHLTGGCLVMQVSHQPDDFLGTIERERVTHTGAALPIIVRAINSGAVAKYDLSSVQDFITLGESELVMNELKVPAQHVFGMSEGMCIRTAISDPLQVRRSMIGRPVSPFDEVKLVDPDTGREVPPGETGEFWARGPYTIRGYYRSPEQNAAKFTSDGFYKSGDLMRAHVLDGVTYYSFEGRIKDNIDRGMEKINAEELERVIIRHPHVQAVYCVGMPDPEYGERVCAYIIPATHGATLSVAELGQFMQAEGVAKFKWPERIELVAAFPTTKLGKTSKALLREDITAKLVAEGRIDPDRLKRRNPG